MKKPDRDTGEARVDALFEAARANPPTPPEALMTRVLADAETEMAQARRPAQATGRPGVWTRLGELIGGWQGVGGLVAATCAGVWIGWNPPAALPDAGALILGYDTAEVLGSTAELTSFGWDLEGG